MNTRTSWTDATSFNSMFYTKEETIQSVKDNFDFRRYYSAEGKSILIDKTYTEQILVQQHSNPLNEDKTDRKIHVSMDSQLKYGSYVTYENSLWLVFSQLKNVDDAYKSAQIRQCNYTLPFQTISSAIIQEPCIVIDTTKASSTGEDEGKIITLSDTQRAILIQYNENTKYLIEGKRIFIDQLTDKPKVYKITKVDRITHMNGEHGLLQLTCDECEVTNTDNVSLKIADYITPSTPPVVPTPSTDYVCKITNTLIPSTEYNNDTNIATCKVGAGKKPFMCHFYNTSGIEITTITPVWSIDVSKLTTTQQLKIHLTYDANYPLRCYLNVDSDNSLIGLSFILNLSGQDGLYHNSVQVKVV
jgi:biopolymer transport protein ExbD